GVVTTLIAKAQFDPVNTLAMVCGPEVMMRFTIRELQKRGMRTDSIYISMERNMKCAVGFLRTLSVRSHIHLQGRSGLSLRQDSASPGDSRDLTWRLHENRNSQSGSFPPAMDAS